jgi:hypothetical protein
MENKRDIRLYQYSAGGLQKVGRNKTGLRPHLFESVEKCEEHIEWLRNKYKSSYKADDNTQYLVIEYFGSYESKILKLL